MRCLISLALGLLALEAALALEPADFTAAQSMCPQASSEKDMDCIPNCSKNQDCAGNAVCCPSSCGLTCKTPINYAPKAGRCPWNSAQIIPSGSCSEKSECARDSDCGGIEKCCTSGCAMKCVKPKAEELLQ